MILAGDIGGTKCNLGLFKLENETFVPVAEETYQSREFDGLEGVVARFLKSGGVRSHQDRIIGACFGVAGPVVNGRAETPNLPWTIDEETLRESVEIESVRVINDLEATAYGITTLPEKCFFRLNAGSPGKERNLALIAAGTGLGEAFLTWETRGYRPIASEGGHSDFAPRNEVEIQLLQYLLRRWDHVSFERVLSGPGLYNIYCFLRDANYAPEPPWFEERTENRGDPAAVISEAALAGESPLCVRALDIFVSIYGAEAGNLALTVIALGGVYVGGGIAPKICPKLKDGTFLEAFCDKGRLSGLMAEIPVHVILEPRTALFGAANCAYLEFGK